MTATVLIEKILQHLQSLLQNLCTIELYDNGQKNMVSANEQSSVQIPANTKHDILWDMRWLNNAIIQDGRPCNLARIYQHSKEVSSQQNVWKLLPHYMCKFPQDSILHYIIFSFLFGIIKSAKNMQLKNSASHTMQYFMPGSYIYFTLASITGMTSTVTHDKSSI